MTTHSNEAMNERENIGAIVAMYRNKAVTDSENLPSVQQVASTDKTATCYWIEKLFTGGPLKGLRWEGATMTKFDVGFVCNKPIGNTSPYRIISCVEKPLYPNH